MVSAKPSASLPSKTPLFRLSPSHNGMIGAYFSLVITKKQPHLAAGLSFILRTRKPYFTSSKFTNSPSSFELPEFGC